MGKVRGSSKDFPYTEVRTSVMIPDPDEQELSLIHILIIFYCA